MMTIPRSLLLTDVDGQFAGWVTFEPGGTVVWSGFGSLPVEIDIHELALIGGARAIDLSLRRTDGPTTSDAPLAIANEAVLRGWPLSYQHAVADGVVFAYVFFQGAVVYGFRRSSDSQIKRIRRLEFEEHLSWNPPPSSR